MKLLAIDIDGILTEDTAWCPDDCLKCKPRQDVINLVNKLYYTAHIIIYTARGEDMRPETEYWLKKHQVKYHALRMDKLPADVYFDDRAINNLTDLNKWMRTTML